MAFYPGGSIRDRDTEIRLTAGHASVDDADRYAAAAVERIEQIDETNRVRIVFGQRHRQQFAFAPAFQGVDDGQSHGEGGQQAFYRG